MKKHLLLTMLLLCAVLLCACSAPNDDTNGDLPGGQGQHSPMDSDAPTPEIVVPGLPEGYDPASEEDNGMFNANAAYDAYGNMIYAGATPIPIDPIDMPTPTARPDLTFNYGEYTASKLGLKFKSAVGYTINDNANNIYILTEPDAAVKDNHACVITLEISSITTSYTAKDIRTDLASYLEAEGSQYTKWQTWTAASKTLMKGEGYYNNYRGELADGTIVRGRVHMAKISDNQLLTLHISAPGWYNSSYMKIYDTIRDSISPLQ